MVTSIYHFNVCERKRRKHKNLIQYDDDDVGHRPRNNKFLWPTLRSKSLLYTKNKIQYTYIHILIR